jgi:hypothetical protein
MAVGNPASLLFKLNEMRTSPIISSWLMVLKPGQQAFDDGGRG